MINIVVWQGLILTSYAWPSSLTTYCQIRLYKYKIYCTLLDLAICSQTSKGLVKDVLDGKGNLPISSRQDVLHFYFGPFNSSPAWTSLGDEDSSVTLN